MRLGGLTLEPQDVEVLTRDFLREYFQTRDVRPRRPPRGEGGAACARALS